MSAKLLQISHLGVQFRQPNSTVVAVRDVSLDLSEGETVALVGESGSGKSVTALSVLQLLPYPVAVHTPGSSIRYRDRELVGADEQTLRRMSMAHTPAQEQAADQKAMELLQSSPYSSRLATVGLFLQQVQHSHKLLPNLINARMGNTIFADPRSSGIATLTAGAPGLERRNLTQIAALPLGGRIKVDAWTGQVEISKARPVPLLRPRENKPFEITPMLPYLSRYAVETMRTGMPANGSVGSAGSASGAQ